MQTGALRDSAVSIQLSAVSGQIAVDYPAEKTNHPPVLSRPSLDVGTALLLLGGAAALLVPGRDHSGPSWDDLIAPYRVGRPVVRGYVLSPPRRGNANDVVYVARRAAPENDVESRVEVHVVDRGRWSGVLESSSFGVAWEVPPPGSMGAATPDDCNAVTAALFEAISANDSGFASVDSIPMSSEPETPPIARIVDRLAAPRGVAIGLAVALAVVLLAPLPYGGTAVGALLLAIGLGLRIAILDLPFAHDQDVQRMLTGNSSLLDIATGVGLQDRHPPLYFFVLHVFQWFGQSEAIGRLPAVIAGALAAPAVLLAAATIRGRVEPAAALAALAVAGSPELIARSREVSGIPLYALLLVAAAASLAAAVRSPSFTRLFAVAASHALALFTYYLAPFVVFANATALAWRRANRPTVVAFACGVLAGAPALLLGFATLVRDWSAREAARAFPTIAWGEHGPLQMATQMVQIGSEAFGPLLAGAILLAAGLGALRRDFAIVLATLGVAATFAAVALLSPIARVQSYYFTSALPLAALVAALLHPRTNLGRSAWAALLMAGVALGTAPSLAGSRNLYLPDADAFMPRFAALAAARPETTVVTVAHYDKTLLAYYLARINGRSIAWRNWEESSKRIVPLVKVHSLHIQSEAALAGEFDRIVGESAVLVVERDAVSLPLIRERLSQCQTLLEAPTGRLLRCAPRA